MRIIKNAKRSVQGIPKKCKQIPGEETRRVDPQGEQAGGGWHPGPPRPHGRHARCRYKSEKLHTKNCSSLRIHPRPHGSTGPPYDAPPHVPLIMQICLMPQIVQVDAIANMATMGQDVLRGIHSRLDLIASSWLLLFNLVE